MTRPRLKTPASVDAIRRKLDRSIRNLQAAGRGFIQRGEPMAALRLRDRIDTLQALREAVFGIPLGPYNANRPLFARRSSRRKAA